jgi:hypothetical protein
LQQPVPLLLAAHLQTKLQKNVPSSLSKITARTVDFNGCSLYIINLRNIRRVLLSSSLNRDEEIMNDQSSEDHRKYRRFPFIEEILVDGINKCTSSDISEGGLFISTIQRFEKDQVIELIVPLKGGKISVKARVTYCQPGIGAGLAFVDMDSVLRAKIKELVDDVAPKSG